MTNHEGGDDRVCGIVREIALKVHGLIRERGAMERFRAMVRQWASEFGDRQAALADWEGRRQEHIEVKGAKGKRNRQKAKGPPSSGWQWEEGVILGLDKNLKLKGFKREFEVGGLWFPPELAQDQRPAEADLPLPFASQGDGLDAGEREPLTLAGRYAVLAAVHDWHCKNDQGWSEVEAVDPWGDPELGTLYESTGEAERKALGRFYALVSVVRNVRGESETEQDGVSLSECCWSVETDLTDQGQPQVEAGIAPSTKPRQKEPRFSQLQEIILKTLGQRCMTGIEIADKANRSYSGHFKDVLKALRDRDILGNHSPGYFITPEYEHLLMRFGQKQD